MSVYSTRAAIITILGKHVDKCGSQKALAGKIGISQTYLSDVLRGRRLPGEKILDFLGFDAVTVYIPMHLRELVARVENGNTERA